MIQAESQTHPAAVKVTYWYEVFELMNRLKIAGERFHLIRAGGVGMSGWAQFLLQKQAIVTGSDQAAGAVTARLNRLGADIPIGHSADNLHPATDAVIVSAAMTAKPSSSRPDPRSAVSKPATPAKLPDDSYGYQTAPATQTNKAFTEFEVKTLTRHKMLSHLPTAAPVNCSERA